MASTPTATCTPAQLQVRAGRAHVGVEREGGAQLGGGVDAAVHARGVVVVRDRAQQDAVDLADPSQHRVGQRGPRGMPDRCRDVELETERKTLVDAPQDLEGRFGDARPDAVAGQYEKLHGLFRSPWARRSPCPGTTSRRASWSSPARPPPRSATSASTSSRGR